MSASPPLHLRLFVSGSSTTSLHARAAVDRLQRDGFVVAESVEIVDVLAEPERAAADRVLVTPTLLRVAPAPSRRVLGDLSDLAAVARALGLDAAR